jgi:hypothetical protein
MDLEVVMAEHKGKANAECVWLRALTDIPSMAYYLVMDSTYTEDGKLSNELRHTFWFRSFPVKKGDYIRLRTGPGTYEVIDNDQGTRTHHVYWGLKETIWNKDGDVAVLFRISEWTSRKA